MTREGHVFVIDGDVSQVHCDAWLLPTDRSFWITDSFKGAVDMTTAGQLPHRPSSWGDQGCLFLEHLNRSGRPHLWLGDIGRFDAPIDHYAQRAREFIEHASERVRNERPDLRHPLLAMNVIGSGHGGKRSQRGELLTALLPAIHDAARVHRCDVVLVAYGAVMYAATQAARRGLEASLTPWVDLDENLRSAGDTLAAQARAGNLVVFMGAGVSVAAGVPAWKPFLQQIGNDLGMSAESLERMKDLDPRDQATIIQRQYPDRFGGAVIKALEVERPSLLHGLLASLPVKEFVTTNFDTLFERAARTANRDIAVIPGGTVRASDRWLLKLHGTLGDDLVLTRGDYLGATSRHVALRGLVQAMLLTRHMLFVGYSLSDEDFHQLVHEVRSALKDDHTIFGTALMPDPHTFVRDLWSDVGIVDTSTRDADVEMAIHRLNVLLDYVGSRTASDVRFLADDSLGQLRTDEEHELAFAIEALRRVYDRHRNESGAWSEVERFLDLFSDSAH